MNMKKTAVKYILSGILIAAFGTGAGAEMLMKPGNALPFLKTGVGARALALGGAFVGLADDATALYWNPAGLAGLAGTAGSAPRDFQFASMYSTQSSDRTYAFAGAAKKLAGDRGCAGVSFRYFKMEEIEGRNEQGGFTQNYSLNSGAVAVSYAREIKSDIRGGASLKYYYENLVRTNAWGLGVDLGMLYRNPSALWQWGAVIQDINTGFYWDASRKDNIDTTIRTGVSYRLLPDMFTAAFDLEGVWKQYLRTHAGLEYLPVKNLALRFGLDDLNLTFGLGVSFLSYELDYSFAYDEYRLGDAHNFSLTARFE